MRLTKDAPGSRSDPHRRHHCQDNALFPPHRLFLTTYWVSFQVLCRAHSCCEERDGSLTKFECKENLIRWAHFIRQKPRDCGPPQKEKALWGLSPLRVGELVLYRGQAALSTKMGTDLHALLGPRGQQNHWVLSFCPSSEPP